MQDGHDPADPPRRQEATLLPRRRHGQPQRRAARPWSRWASFNPVPGRPATAGAGPGPHRLLGRQGREAVRARRGAGQEPAHAGAPRPDGRRGPLRAASPAPTSLPGRGQVVVLGRSARRSGSRAGSGLSPYTDPPEQHSRDIRPLAGRGRGRRGRSPGLEAGRPWPARSKLDGVETPEAARLATGAEICGAARRLAADGAGRVLLHDLIGLEAVNREGEPSDGSTESSSCRRTRWW